MGLLSDQMQADASVFTDTDAFGETIVYTPKGAAAKPINGVVFRYPMEDIGAGVQGANRFRYELQINTDATLGIASINRAGDRVSVAREFGSAVMLNMSVEEVLSQDPGMWHLRLA